MARRVLRYPHDVQRCEVPLEAMQAARYETYRFLCNYWVWQGDLHYLCAICYLQGAMDGARVQQDLAAHGESPHA